MTLSQLQCRGTPLPTCPFLSIVVEKGEEKASKQLLDAKLSAQCCAYNVYAASNALQMQVEAWGATPQCDVLVHTSALQHTTELQQMTADDSKSNITVSDNW
jgi:hypothetical protein